MVDIQDAVHALADDIVHDFLHPGHPGRVDVIARPGGRVPPAAPLAVIGQIGRYRDLSHMRIPGHGDADGVESGLLEHMEKRPGRDGLSPRRLIGRGLPVRIGLDPHVVQVPAVGIQRIPQVPPGAHVADGRRSVFPLRRFLGRYRRSLRRFLGCHRLQRLPAKGIAVAAGQRQQDGHDEQEALHGIRTWEPNYRRFPAYRLRPP